MGSMVGGRGAPPPQALRALAGRLRQRVVGGPRGSVRIEQPRVPARVRARPGALPLVVVDPGHSTEPARKREQELLVLAGRLSALVGVLPVAPALYSTDLRQPDRSGGEAQHRSKL